jgi:hypothetical protein
MIPPFLRNNMLFIHIGTGIEDRQNIKKLSPGVNMKGIKKEKGIYHENSPFCIIHYFYLTHSI